MVSARAGDGNCRTPSSGQLDLAKAVILQIVGR
jgi:hypothetical protein